MAYPSKTILSYSYTGFQQSQGNNSFPGTSLDNDLINLRTSLDQTIDFLKVSLGSDGRPAPNSVGLNALSFEVRQVLQGEVIAEVDAIAANIALAAVGGMSADNLQAAIEELFAGKAVEGHTHSASTIPVSAIAGLVANNVQSALAELRAFLPRTGDAQLTLDNTAPSGWIMMDEGTIGATGSGASTRANNDCEDLFTLIYNRVSNTYAPVSGGRGVNAALDWAAGKTIGLTKQLGRAICIAGAGSGLTSRELGQVLGAETHTLTGAQSGQKAISAAPVTIVDLGHVHTETRRGQGNAQGGAGAEVASDSLGSTNTGSSTTGISASFTLAASDAASAHNIMQPSSFWNIKIKL